MPNLLHPHNGHTNVITADGLLTDEALQERSENKEFRYNSFDFIITNPPFGSSIKLNERAYLRNYDFGNKDVSWLDTKNTSVKERANQSTEILFIEQCWRFLKTNRYLAIVIPDGILTNSSLQYVRNNIEEWFRIVAVVSMPQTAFAHTGAGVKSSVLFLRKWDSEITEKYQTLKKELQEEIKIKNNFLNIVDQIEKEKRKTIKEHIDFENLTGETDRKKIEKSDEFQEWKKKISETFNQKINDLKDELEDQYQTLKQEKLDDYQIFMAIAEDIGYDATGKPTGNNELEVIKNELIQFITHIEQQV
ncbi:MAG: SAM-dependent DNA methyltransferase [Candidatus Cloacimonetes bacterium]|nr:SAM-dependent DNA methyltransferase [Candidatus Cloacimonadota bacterium]